MMILKRNRGSLVYFVSDSNNAANVYDPLLQSSIIPGPAPSPYSALMARLLAKPLRSTVVCCRNFQSRTFGRCAPELTQVPIFIRGCVTMASDDKGH